MGSGYYSDLAVSIGAVQLWPEHRYYAIDEDNSPPDSNYEHLTIEKALVDQVELVLHIQRQYGLDRAPVIAIGASYSKYTPCCFMPCTLLACTCPAASCPTPCCHTHYVV